jgi:hypothetical protein
VGHLAKSMPVATCCDADYPGTAMRPCPELILLILLRRTLTLRFCIDADRSITFLASTCADGAIDWSERWGMSILLVKTQPVLIFHRLGAKAGRRGCGLKGKVGRRHSVTENAFSFDFPATGSKVQCVETRPALAPRNL